MVPDNPVYATHCDTLFLKNSIVHPVISSATQIISPVVYVAQYTTCELLFIFLLVYIYPQPVASKPRYVFNHAAEVPIPTIISLHDWNLHSQ